MSFRDAIVKSRTANAVYKYFTGGQLGSSLLFGTAVPQSYWPSITPESGRVGGNFQDPAQHTVVASIIRRIADCIGTTGMTLYMRDEQVDEHPILDLLRMPMPGMGWRQLAVCIADGLIANGNVYLLPVSSTELRLLDWRYVSPPRMNAMYYEYRNPLTGGMTRYGLEEVIHLRWQLAPDGINGLGPLRASALREVATDTVAAEYTDTILRRMGVPGIVATPGKDVTLTQPEADSFRSQLNSAYTGGNRGMAAVTNKQMDFHEVGGAMQRADMRVLRWVPEERICAAIPIPPALLNIGTGSEQVRIGAVLDHLLREFWVGKMMPLMTDIAEQLTMQLVPWFGGLEVYRLAPDFANAPVIARIEAERQNQQLEVAVTAYHSGLLTFEEAREKFGYDRKPDGQLLAVPINERREMPPPADGSREAGPPLTDGKSLEQLALAYAGICD